MRLAWTRIPLSFYPASGDDLGKSLLDWKLSCTTRRVERGTRDLPSGRIPYRGFEFDGGVEIENEVMGKLRAM
jgi:hypothetical protein